VVSLHRCKTIALDPKINILVKRSAVLAAILRLNGEFSG